SKPVEFPVTVEDLKFYNSQLEYVAEPGEFEFFVGGTSDCEMQGSFTLVEE
ncbi:fibronectin type III-like domain-contianing protein, partial [Salinimicrobium oceani]